ncbi:endonuclease/exonuclease/phosphatase family protein [Aureispira sp. CCB-QB1]|uniref:endonuclease/exonuclease/phosphatase family protein n=1 Tax=Aureispira sp. CCB-QB1 TaxID=1313421 RepID=UPI000697389C|nr:endonuclease/exonuclease/phosphatase family protein [Aureispira sp. CCB-QB1]
MKKLRKIIYFLFLVTVLFLLGCAILSIFINTESRFLKILDFPRIQFFLASFILFSLFLPTIKTWRWYDGLLAVSLLASMAIQGHYLINYTPLVAVTVPAAPNNISPNNQFSILLLNVKMSNKEAQPVIDLLRDKRPDLVLLMETDNWWNEQLVSVEQQYSYNQKAINEVSYGMILYSKYPITTTVHYLHNKKVPSFESIVSLPNRKFCFYGTHPPPPQYFDDIPDNEGQREAELQLLGKKVKNNALPSILAGDINDVVWSYTDYLTHTENLLFDVRVGRGFCNSFNAHNFLMRWPLDHIFVTKEFRLKNLEALPSVGADHYPIYVELVL